jgi:hypothetical protein
MDKSKELAREIIDMVRAYNATVCEKTGAIELIHGLSPYEICATTKSLVD